jgi:hypothetical protein
MAWRIVKQPNGLFARFSDVVDDFTDYDLTEAQAWELCIGYGGVDLTDEKLANAKSDLPDPRRKSRPTNSDGLNRWRECIEIIRSVHGSAEANNREAIIGTEARP